MAIPFVPGEIDLLVTINNLHHPILDALMYSVSNVAVWVPIACTLIGYLYYKKPAKEATLLLGMLIATVLIGNLVGNAWAKPFFARVRPSLTPEISEQLHLVYGYTARSYSFYSGHAANFFAFATMLALVVGRRRHSILLVALVSLVAYSRLYQGVHFVSDVLVGMAIGGMIGYAGYRLYLGLRRRLGWQAPLGEMLTPGYRAWMLALYLFVPLVLVHAYQTAHIIERLGAG